MGTIHRAHGIRFVIYTQDHEPAHIHVLGDGELKIALSLDDGLPELIFAIGMKAATPDQLAGVEIAGAGSGLHWEALDVDLSVPALMAGSFGTKAWMRELARRAGSVTSPAKAAAARANGAKGGRPRKLG